MPFPSAMDVSPDRIERTATFEGIRLKLYRDRAERGAAGMGAQAPAADRTGPKVGRYATTAKSPRGIEVSGGLPKRRKDSTGFDGAGGGESKPVLLVPRSDVTSDEEIGCPAIGIRAVSAALAEPRIDAVGDFVSDVVQDVGTDARWA